MPIHGLLAHATPNPTLRCVLWNLWVEHPEDDATTRSMPGSFSVKVLLVGVARALLKCCPFVWHCASLEGPAAILTAGPAPYHIGYASEAQTPRPVVM